MMRLVSSKSLGMFGMETSYHDFLFDHETDVHLAYYSSIGRVIVNWSMLESQWDICMWMLFTSLDGNTLAKEPPVSMKRKIGFWNACFKNLKSLAAKKDDALEFSPRLGDASKERNIMLHTSWGNMIGSKPEPSSISGSGMRSGQGGFSHYSAKMTLEDLHELLVETSNLQAMLLPITFFLTELSNRQLGDKFQSLHFSDQTRLRVPNAE
jgi:hypothetical protein